MFKRLGILAILIVMALMVSVPAVAAQGGPPPDRGQPRGQVLATGSIWVHPQGIGNDIHINFNARQVNDAGVGTGHVFWREGGEIYRVNVNLLIIWPEPNDVLCAYISGIAHTGERSGEQLCFMFCDNNFVLGAAWAGPPAYFMGAPVLSGNIVIKP